MGVGGSTLKQAEIADLAQHSHFDKKEISQLFVHFHTISREGRMDPFHFKTELGLRDNLLTNRLFLLFDQNRDGFIDFRSFVQIPSSSISYHREFVQGLSILGKRGTVEEKIRCLPSIPFVKDKAFLGSFRMYDIDGDGSIDFGELCQIMKASFLQGEDMTDVCFLQPNADAISVPSGGNPARRRIDVCRCRHGR